MSIGLNRVTLIGRLGRDPEVRSFENGKNSRFTLATDEEYKNKAGEKVSRTEWHNITMWRGLAEVAEKYLRKGDLIYVDGKLRNRSYEQDGVKKFFTEIEAENMVMLGRSQGGQSPQDSNSGNKDVANNVDDISSIFIPNGSEDDDLPF